MTVDINAVAENLAELLSNSNNVTDKLYDIFLNPLEMDVTLQRYNSSNQLVTVTIPNRAKDRRIALSGTDSPEGVVTANIGACYVDTAYNSVYFKTANSGENTGWQAVLTQASVEQLLTNYVPTTRTVNSKALSSNISLSASDVGALATSTSYGASLSFSNNNLNLVDQNSTVISSVSIGTTGSNKDLSNLSTTGEAHFANPSLSNLDSTGEGHFSKTDLSNSSLSSTFKTLLLDTLFPIGAIYLDMKNIGACPIQSTLGGTWQLINGDGALWEGNGWNGGDWISQGLPNITGSIDVFYEHPGTGAFYDTGNRTTSNDGGAYWNSTHNFDASRSNSIYGASSRVQPQAHRVNVWKRTA